MTTRRVGLRTAGLAALILVAPLPTVAQANAGVAFTTASESDPTLNELQRRLVASDAAARSLGGLTITGVGDDGEGGTKEYNLASGWVRFPESFNMSYVTADHEYRRLDHAYTTEPGIVRRTLKILGRPDAVYQREDRKGGLERYQPAMPSSFTPTADETVMAQSVVGADGVVDFEVLYRRVELEEENQWTLFDFDATGLRAVRPVASPPGSGTTWTYGRPPGALPSTGLWVNANAFAGIADLYLLLPHIKLTAVTVRVAALAAISRGSTDRVAAVRGAAKRHAAVKSKMVRMRSIPSGVLLFRTTPYGTSGQAVTWAPKASRVVIKPRVILKKS